MIHHPAEGLFGGRTAAGTVMSELHKAEHRAKSDLIQENTQLCLGGLFLLQPDRKITLHQTLTQALANNPRGCSWMYRTNLTPSIGKCTLLQQCRDSSQLQGVHS